MGWSLVEVGRESAIGMSGPELAKDEPVIPCATPLPPEDLRWRRISPAEHDPVVRPRRRARPFRPIHLLQDVAAGTWQFGRWAISTGRRTVLAVRLCFVAGAPAMVLRQNSPPPPGPARHASARLPSTLCGRAKGEESPASYAFPFACVPPANRYRPPDS